MHVHPTRVSDERRPRHFLAVSLGVGVHMPGSTLTRVSSMREA